MQHSRSNHAPSRDSLPVRLLLLLFWAASLGWGMLFVTLPLAWKPQILLGVVMVTAGIFVGRTSRSPMVTITLMVLSLFATMRYAWWRAGAVIDFFRNPSTHWDWADAVCIVVLMCAESYAFIILFLGFMQTVWPLKRPPVSLPENEAEWPHVDLLIPTYNEPLSVVRYTALAAMNVDWPADKLHIYILDDGRRDTFRDFAHEAGVGYVTREDNLHAKAGNINRALEKLDAPYVAIFDCDHLPTRSFLQVTMGWFLREARLAMVQTPHHFYSADPFERNLKQFRLIPNEGELFYGVVQDGNDFWNATFFCGSCAVLRRTALDEIGGIAVETVTEDAHTSLRMQMRGWNTAYINIPQAAGLATERLSGHIQQRVRWARGMIQILRTDNPLFARGLKFAQRICYFNAMTHFLYAVPRLIFLTAPLVYLFFSRSNVPGYWAAILAYAMPHLVLSNVTNSRIQGQHRHSFWNEIYETVLSPYILLPTLTALINPKLGKFNVTAKGGFVEETYFDGKIATPFVVLMLLNIAGLLMVVPRLVHVPGMERFWDAAHPGTIAMNALWCAFNLIILGVAITVAREEIQRREQVRIDFVMPARLRFANGAVVSGQTIDISIGGTALATPDDVPFFPGEWVTLLLPLRVGDAELPAVIIGREDGMLRLRFEALSLFEEEMLTTILYSRADAWVNWGEAREPDRPLRSFYRILKLSVRGMAATFSTLTFGRRHAARAAEAAKATKLAGRIASLLLCCITLHTARSQTTAAGRAAKAGSFAYATSLGDLGLEAPIELHGLDGFHTVSFVLPRDQVVDRADLRLVYSFSTAASASGEWKLLLNGTAFATLQPETHRGPSERVIPVPSELLARSNELTFEFIGRQGVHCDEHASAAANGVAAEDALWGRIDPSSSLSLTGQRLSLANDLHDLPLPFIDTQITRDRVIPIVLAAAPPAAALQAAGIVASYFGMAAEYPVPRFPVSLGTLPRGNVIVVAESSAAVLSTLQIGPVTSPLLALRTNPNDPFGKVLIVTGADAGQLVLAAQALALQGPALQGASVGVEDVALPSLRGEDDAPRWASVGIKAPLWTQQQGSSRQSDGSGPLQIFLRVPPDLYAADRTSLDLHLDYGYSGSSIASGSALLVQANGSAIASIPLKPESRALKKADIPLPIAALRPFSNSLTAQWSMRQKNTERCAIALPGSFTGSIQGTSFLDLRGLSHWAAMPNLELFSNAGFPFTRFADLAQTTVILPDQSSAQEIEVYLTLLAHFSAQTGYPALRVRVGSAADLHSGADTDLLVIGTGADDPGILQAGSSLPVALDGEQLLLRKSPGTLAQLQAYLRSLMAYFNDSPISSDASQLPGSAPEALLAAAESPYAPRRSLVVVQLRDAAAATPFLARFLAATHSSEISGDVSVLTGQAFQSFRLGDSSYALGHRPWLVWLKVSMVHGPWLLVFGLLPFSLIAAARIQARLRERSKLRLHLEEEPHDP